MSPGAARLQDTPHDPDTGREEETPRPGNRLEKRTYTVGEIREILGISSPTAYALVKRNLFHSIRIGGKIRISRKSFDAWLDQDTL